MIRLWHLLADLLFPRKCVLCQELLQRGETDICGKCLSETEDFSSPETHTYLHKWTAVWYYEGNVRESILRFKFGNARSYASAYGRRIAMKLLREGMAEEPFVLTWVPVSRKRKRRRGYDQVELIARAVGAELGSEPVSTLVKTRHNRAQSGIADSSARRANVLGAYRIRNPEQVRGKRVILLDDVLTTGSTAGECARVLLTAGAKQVDSAVVASVRRRRSGS